MDDPPTEPEKDKPPDKISPSPAALLAALIVAGLIVYNLFLDSGSEDYDGSKATYGLVLALCTVLGFDLSRIWPRK